MYVAYLRYIQSIHESPEHRNPDTLVGYFMPLLERWRVAWLGRRKLPTLRTEPFYYYLVARTRYYDQVIKEAVADGVRRIAIVGCGSDTRAYRFQQLLRSNGVKVLECDQAQAIQAKQLLAKRRWCCDHVEYLPIDLNDDGWPELECWLGEGQGTGLKTLVFMEGVSPYVNDLNFGRFLLLLATKLSPGSHVAYDFKIRGSQDDFGRGGRTEKPFRLGQASEEVMSFHAAHGLRLQRFELSSELCARLLPALAKSTTAFFAEDALVRLEVGVAQGGRDPA